VRFGLSGEKCALTFQTAIYCFSIVIVCCPLDLFKICQSAESGEQNSASGWISATPNSDWRRRFWACLQIAR